MWLSPARRQVLRAHLTNPPAWLESLIQRAKSSDWADEKAVATDYPVRLAMRTLLFEDSAAAQKSLDLWAKGWRENPGTEDLGKAHAALTGAILQNACGDLWTPDARQIWKKTLREICAAHFEVSSGNPHTIGNNWWAVTHSGLYCGAAALLDAGGCEGFCGRSLEEVETWAWARLDAFLTHFGEGGAYHEGLGYQDYTCSYLLPAVLLHNARSGVDVGQKFPALAEMAATLFCSGIEGEKFDDVSGSRLGWGRQLSWNDAGLGWPDSAVPLLATVLAPENLRAAARECWDRLSGHRRPDRHVSERFGALFFVATYYPEDAEHGDQLPLTRCDRKQGLWLTRNTITDRNDAVLGAYARSYYPGGHSQHDAGSFRFSALGWDWVIGGGQARPEACWQSVVTSSDPESPARCGLVLWDSEGVFGVDLRKVHQSYSERYLAFHVKAPTAVAVLDLINDHRTDRDWSWNLTFPPELTVSLRGDGFRLRAPDGATMDATFLGMSPKRMEIAWSPESKRRYANGAVVGYISRPAVRAHFPREQALAIYTILTVFPPEGEVVSPMRTSGTSVAWGEHVWNRPFAAAIPAGLEPCTLRGQCRWPC